MEKRSGDPSAAAPNWNLIDSGFALPNKNTYLSEIIDEKLAFDEAVAIAGDWIAAEQPSPITPQEFANLYERGFVTYPPDIIEGIFEDWDDFLEVSQTFYSDRIREKESKDQKLLASVYKEVELGLVPPKILEESVGYEIQYCEVSPKASKPGKVISLQRHEFTGQAAPEKQLLQRYAKLLVVDYLIDNRGIPTDITDERKLGIIMGFNINSSKALSSFFPTLKNTIAELTKFDIERASLQLDVYEYVYAYDINLDLGRMVKAAKGKLPVQPALLAA